ncbi:MAG: DUF481 domain-containing protein [Bacteroidota bacterium]
MKKTLLSLIFMMTAAGIYAQVDSLLFSNGNYIVGELKGMDRGVLTIETDYSDDDFTIEWDGIKELYTTSHFLVTLSDGTRLNGRLESSEQGRINIITEDEGTIDTESSEIVFLKSVDKGFLDRVYANIDIGLDLAKANSFRQFSTRSSMGYLAERWSDDIYFNTLYSEQDETDPIHRTEGGTSFKFYLPSDWFIPASVIFLSNTEQKLDLRTTANIGIGKYIIHTNKTYWGFSVGANYNNENYSTDADDRNSMEGSFGTELNMYDIGDLNLLTRIIAYPSFTESGRWRSDFNFDMKYDLPMDFYVKLGFTLNYDNRPVEGASEIDYVFHTGFGWEW